MYGVPLPLLFMLTCAPHFDDVIDSTHTHRPSASYAFTLRGTAAELAIFNDSSTGHRKRLKLKGNGPPQNIRLVWDGVTKIVTIGTGYPDVSR